MSYNCVDYLIEAVRSVQSFVTEACEIIIVDNASIDRTRELVPGLDPRIKFIASEVNLGFSAGNNLGFKSAVGDKILLLNPDASLINYDLRKALVYLENNPNIILGPRILNSDGSLQDSVLRVPGFFPVLTETFFLSYFLKNNMTSEIKDRSYALSGACLLMQRDVYAKLGGFDEDLFWMDDVDLCTRASQLGINCVYFPEWTVKHVIGESSKKNYKVVIANQLISKIKFFKKHGQRFNYVSSIILTQVHILLRILLFFLLSPFKTTFRLKFYAYCSAQKLFFKYIFTGQKQLL